MFRLKDVVENPHIRDYYMCNEEGVVYGKSGKPLAQDRGGYKIATTDKPVKVAVSTIKEKFVDNSEWREVNHPGVKQGLYLVHKDSRVKNANRGTLVETSAKSQTEPRKKINLHGQDGDRVSCILARVVALAWCENDDPENKIEVDHIIPVCMGGGDEASNLEWVTPDENRRRWESFRLSK